MRTKAELATKHLKFKQVDFNFANCEMIDCCYEFEFKFVVGFNIADDTLNLSNNYEGLKLVVVNGS